jgi:predicted Zn-dependent protease
MRKSSFAIWFVLIASVLFPVLASSRGPLILPPVETEKPKSTPQLKEEVDKILSSRDPVMIRRNIKEVFTLIDRLVELKKNQEAFDYLTVALQHDSWAMGYQMLYAEMLQTRGESNLAHKRAELVLEYAEKDELVNRARRLLQERPLPTIPELSRIDGTDISISLVALGDIDICVLRDLRQMLHQKLTIPIHLYATKVPIPSPKRDPFKYRISEVRSALQKDMIKDHNLEKFLEESGVKYKDLENDQAVIHALRLMFYSMKGKEGLINFDKEVKQLQAAEKQWDIDDLLNTLRSAVALYRKERVYFLGVANLDAFADKGNFIFGTAENNAPHAVITYRRFTGDFYSNNPNRKRLVERAFKQSLSSIGFMLGVVRCSTPTCARAYPHSLDEHDAKSMDLCESCKIGFQQFLGKKLK